MSSDKTKTIRFDDKGNTLLSIPMSGVPPKQWDEWNSECIAFYAGNRWSKTWSDHEKAKAYDILCHTLRYHSEPEYKEEEIIEKKESDLLNPET